MDVKWELPRPCFICEQVLDEHIWFGLWLLSNKRLIFLSLTAAHAEAGTDFFPFPDRLVSLELVSIVMAIELNEGLPNTQPSH